MSSFLQRHLLRAAWTPSPPLVARQHSIRLQSTSSDQPSAPYQQLVELHELITAARASNGAAHKRSIILQYPQLRELLELVHDPHVRFGLTPRVLNNYISNPTAGINIVSGISSPSSLVELLNLLAERRITGTTAKETVRVFLDTNGITPDEPEVYDTFMRVLERGLDAGFATSTLSKLKWPGDEGEAGTSRNGPALRPPRPTRRTRGSSAPSENGAAGSSALADPTAAKKPYGSRNLKRFSCALGKAVGPEFGMISAKNRWFASRKLDGVRVLTLLDFYLPNDQSVPVELDSVSFRSRTGNEFTSLARLEDQLRHLAGYPGLRDFLSKDPEIIEERDGGVVKRLVLDGEVCHMVPAQGQTVRVGDDGTGASVLWENDGLVEDFQLAVSMVRRVAPMDRPLYFVFDVLNWVEVAEGDAIQSAGPAKTFGARVEDTKEIIGWLRQKITEEGGGEPKIRALIQQEVQGKEDADAMVKRAMDEGWEGLIFRMDRPYKGKRSNEILKFKKLQDAEYEVLDVETNRMRLSINGVFDEYEALSNVWIEHKGHRVSVGTGFTAEERVRFGADPSQISLQEEKAGRREGAKEKRDAADTQIGRQMTVEYFSESQAVSRDAGLSLRFPRVKKIWDEARDV